MVRVQSEARIEAETKEKAILLSVEQTRRDMQGIFNVLAEADRQHFPESLLHQHIQPASLGGGTRFAISVRGEFLNDLDALQIRIQHLQAELTAIRRRFPFLIHRIYREQARVAQARFRAHAQRDLKASAKHGGPGEETTAKLQAESAAVVRKWVSLLRMDASTENAKGVLDAVSDLLMLGGSSNSGAYAEAFAALRGAARVKMQRALAAFQANPTDANRQALGNGCARALFLGVDSKVVDPYLKALQPGA
jgi:hypothetical protein